MRACLDNCCYNHPFNDQKDLRTALESERFVAHLSRESMDYTKWRQDKFEDLSLENSERATRESGQMVRNARKVEAALHGLSSKSAIS